MEYPKLRAEVYAQVLALFARAMSIVLVPLIAFGLIEDALGDGFLMAFPSTFGESFFLALLLICGVGLVLAWRSPFSAGTAVLVADLALILLLNQRFPEHGIHWVFVAMLLNAVFFILSESILPKRT